MRYIPQLRTITILARLGVFLLLFIFLLYTPFHATPNDGERINVLAADCATAKAVFTLGETVCAVAAGADLDGAVRRRFVWVAPDGTIFQLGPDIVADPDSNSITVPSSGHYAQVGTWTVKTVDLNNNGYAVAQFRVQDPNNQVADLSINMFVPFQAAASADVTFTVVVSNNGPDDAQDVQVKIGAATYAIPISAEQTSGPQFNWMAVLQERSPSGICTIATLPVNATASFACVYRITAGAPNGTIISSTAAISSVLLDIHPANNQVQARATVSPQPCTLKCPADITAQKSTGQCGAVVTFAAPATAGNKCGAMTCNPASGAFFPVGTTTVTCASNTDSPCSFKVTVSGAQTPALHCPADITVNETSPGMGLAIVNYKSLAAGDNCADETATCSPPSGSSFSLGTTTVNCESSRSTDEHADCSFTVTVRESDCVLRSPADIIKAGEAGGCGTLINYPTPTMSGSCGEVTCAPPSGTIFSTGVTTVSCISTTGASTTFTVTVEDIQAPEISKVFVTPSTLLSPDGRLKEVIVNYQATDNCSEDVTCALSVTSSEPASVAADGMTISDWEILDAHHLWLLVESGSKSKEHIYTITITCTDASGNSSSKAVIVSTTHNLR